MWEILTVGTDTSLLNLLLFMDQGWTEDKNLLRNRVKKKKNFGQQNVSEDRIDTATEQITASRIGASIVVWTERTSTTRGHARHTVRSRRVAARDARARRDHDERGTLLRRDQP